MASLSLPAGIATRERTACPEVCFQCRRPHWTLRVRLVRSFEKQLIHTLTVEDVCCKMSCFELPLWIRRTCDTATVSEMFTNYMKEFDCLKILPSDRVTTSAHLFDTMIHLQQQGFLRPSQDVTLLKSYINNGAELAFFKLDDYEGHCMKLLKEVPLVHTDCVHCMISCASTKLGTCRRCRVQHWILPVRLIHSFEHELWRTVLVVDVCPKLPLKRFIKRLKSEMKKSDRVPDSYLEHGFDSLKLLHNPDRVKLDYSLLVDMEHEHWLGTETLVPLEDAGIADNVQLAYFKRTDYEGYRNELLGETTPVWVQETPGRGHQSGRQFPTVTVGNVRAIGRGLQTISDDHRGVAGGGITPPRLFSPRERPTQIRRSPGTRWSWLTGA